MDSNLILQIITSLMALLSILVAYFTIRANKELNQKILFSNITNEERALRIKFQEYREKLTDKSLSNSEKIQMEFAHDTLLFNYYEYLAICLHEKLVNEKETKLYFKDILPSIKKYFETSILFEEGQAEKSEYKGIQWLFRKWNV